MIGGAVALVVAVLVASYLVLRPHSNPVSPLPAAQARPSAERACALMRQFESQVLSNSDAKVALATLDEAITASNHAARGDVIWVRLESGTQAVRRGFRKNDARATRVGIDVVRDACSEFAPAAPTP